ncbi:DUF4862 family protein [Arthrobacter sp. NPDC058130]|uniref:DUF4862 family protein n=1 Tax=Arthrobacter sp. NPDC058130 TaxID=3346353 RepID=UPI0036E7F7B6
MTAIVYSAYNAAPAGLADDATAEDLWYSALRSEPRIGGLELPVIGGTLHPHGLDRMADLLDPEWSNTISAMSMTLGALTSSPHYGLASVDRGGRQLALADIADAREATLRLQERLGPDSVRAFALQSAPRADRSRLSAFTESLAEIATWDWGNIELLVEHSDALIAGQTPQKGYLALEEEVAAVRSVAASNAQRIRHLLNWGRSAIEGRNATTPCDHIQIVGAGLGGFAFSGAGPLATKRSAEWEDAHLGLSADEPESLLSRDALHAVLTKLPDDLSYIGVKTGAAARSRGLERLQLGLSMLGALSQIGRRSALMG